MLTWLHILIAWPGYWNKMEKLNQWMELYSEYAFLVEEIRRKEARESKL